MKVRILTLVGVGALLLLAGAMMGTRAARADCVVNVAGCTPTPSTTTSTPPTTAPALPGSTTTTTSPARVATHDDAAGARHLLDLVNAERTKAGAPALTMRDDVRSIAVDWSYHMASVRQLSHNTAYFSPATHSRLGARTEAENVALNYSVDQAHQAFMDSPHHRDNLMNPIYRVAGFAVVVDGDGEYWVTEDFVEPAPAAGSTVPRAGKPTGPGSAAVTAGGGVAPTATGQPSIEPTPTTDGLSALLHRSDSGQRARATDGPGDRRLLAAALLRGKPLQLTAAFLLYLMAFFANRAYSSRRRAEMKAS